MIGYNKLGSNGRLGNQMFQYAALRGIAAKRGYDWCIPPEDYNHTDNYGLFETFELKNISENNIGFINGQIVEENGHSFSSDFFDECPDNISLNGYFQTEKYFEHIAEEIREDFSFKDSILSGCKEYIESLDSSPIFLHIRRTDAIGREQYHPILPISYFEDALKHFSDDTLCFVLTDDIEWCKEQEFFKQDRFLFNESNSRYQYKTVDGTGKMQNTLLPHIDLCLMSLCSGAIIANSSFSWWGAWLQNGRGKVVAPDPQKWFGTAMSDLDTSDIVPQRWVIQEWSK
jgi:hypothetical protein